MKRLSLWAYHHKWTARLLIALCYIILNLVGFVVGDLLLSMEVQFSAWLVYLFTAVFLAAFILYPSRREKHQYRNFYTWQKTCDGLLITTTFLLVIGAANLRQAAHSPFRLSTVQALVPSSVQPPKTATIEKKEHKRSFVQKVKSKLSKAVQAVRSYWKSRTTAEKVLLIFLAVVLAAAALLGVLGLACNLSCAGNEGAALLVGVLGGALIIFLFARAIRGINRTYHKERDKPQPVSGS